MALFQLDSQGIVARVKADAREWPAPTLGESLLRGGLGFTLVSIAGFLPWAASEFWLRGMGELQMYAVSVVAFIALSGICLHRLIIGPATLVRFYKLFGLAFLAYSVAWIGLWMLWRGQAGAYGGLLGGALAMGATLAFGFGTPAKFGAVFVALFVPNLLGYLAGEWAAAQLGFGHRFAAMMSWAVGFGLGLGLGLGFAFYLCQAEARRLLARDDPD